jgi:pimeloyl-ACP methyl ester carboxylesterase
MKNISKEGLQRMNDITRVFIHGLDSSSQGTKGSYFRKRYPEMLIGDYFGTLKERMDKLLKDMANNDNLIIVGSSYGGLMATIFACMNESRVRRLILLAPALFYSDFSVYCKKPLQIPVTVYHGNNDTVVLPEPTREIAKVLFRDLDYRLVVDDHSLHMVFPKLDWDSLLEVRR